MIPAAPKSNLAPDEDRPQRLVADWAEPYDFAGRREWIKLFFLLAITAVAYTPIFSSQFFWRDDQTILSNPAVRSLHAAGHTWLHPRSVAVYRPVADTLFALEYSLWGSWNPAGYHIISLGLHLLATMLVWRVLRKLEVPAAIVGAGLFALHPVAVHAIAWASQQPVLLASVFACLSLLAWLAWNDPEPTIDEIDPAPAIPRRRLMLGAATIACFIASMLSDAPTSCAVPMAMLLIALWKRTGRRHIGTLAAISAIITGVFIWAQWQQLSPPRLFMHALCVHLSKLFVPYPLLLTYSRSGVAEWIVIGLSAAAMVLIWKFRQHVPRRGMVGLRVYLVLLLPPVLLSDVIIDSQQYLARAAMLALLAAAVMPLIPEREEGDDARHAATRPIVGAILLFLLAFGTFWQALICRTNTIAWEHVLAFEPDSRLARLEMGNDALARHDSSAALDQFNRLVARDPNDADAQLRLGEVQMDQGNLDEATASFEKAAALRPNDPSVWRHLGTAAARRGDLSAAVTNYEKALTFDPRGDDLSRNNLATLYVRQGQIDRAIATYQQILQSNPRNATVHVNLARLLFDTGHPTDAADHLKQAVAIDPGNFDAYLTAGDVLMKLKDFHQAQRMFQQAVHLRRDNALALNALGVSLAAQGQWNEAVYQFGRALDADPTYAPAKKNLDRARQDRDAATTRP